MFAFDLCARQVRERYFTTTQCVALSFQACFAEQQGLMCKPGGGCAQYFCTSYSVCFMPRGSRQAGVIISDVSLAALFCQTLLCSSTRCLKRRSCDVHTHPAAYFRRCLCSINVGKLLRRLASNGKNERQQMDGSIDDHRRLELCSYSVVVAHHQYSSNTPT